MKTKLPLRDMTQIAIGAALITVCSWLSIPFTIPFTLQTFAVCLVGALFGWKKGLWTVGLYIALGLVGVPVFSGFRGGAAALFGTTGGYIIGFLFTVALVGLAADLWGRRLPVLILSGVVGILVCYVFGTAWFMVLYTKNSGPVSLMTALGWCVFPYLLPDGIKLLLASILAGRLYPLVTKPSSR